MVNLAELSPEELARRAQAGSSEAFDALIGRYAPALRQYLRRRCGNAEDAEDVRQETLLRVWRNIAKYDRSRPFWPWLLAVARNLAANRAGNRRPDEGAAPGANTAFETADPAAPLIERERSDNLWAAAKRELDERQYAALWFRYGREMTVKQIARAMGLTKTHVKVTLFRARRRLLRSEAVEKWR